MNINSAYSQCKSISLHDLNAQLKFIKKPVELIFFSTWCSDCKDEILNAQKEPDYKEKYILINSFDTEDKAEKVLKKLNIDMICYYDIGNEIAKKFKVTSVPEKVLFDLR